MKTYILSIATAILLAPYGGSAQGTFVYDQQSADESAGGGGFVGINANQPMGQSFTPALNSVGFIRLQLADAAPGNGIGAAVYVNLRQSSITGSILGSSDPVSMTNGFGIGNRGYVDFFFSTEVSLIPGAIYYFQPVLQSGDTSFAVLGYNYGYSGGTIIVGGVPDSFNDLWFREGIIVPEPSSISLVLVGSGIYFLRSRRKGEVSKSCVG